MKVLKCNSVSIKFLTRCFLRLSSSKRIFKKNKMCRKCCYSKILHPISQRIVTNLWFWWQLVSICVASYMSSLAPFFLDFVSGFYISRLVYYVEWDAIDEIKSIWSLHIITKKVNSIHHKINRLLAFVNVWIGN